jgi:hypothetical protein
VKRSQLLASQPSWVPLCPSDDAERTELAATLRNMISAVHFRMGICKKALLLFTDVALHCAHGQRHPQVCEGGRAMDETSKIDEMLALQSCLPALSPVDHRQSKCQATQHHQLKPKQAPADTGYRHSNGLPGTIQFVPKEAVLSQLAASGSASVPPHGKHMVFLQRRLGMQQLVHCSCSVCSPVFSVIPFTCEHAACLNMALA